MANRLREKLRRRFFASSGLGGFGVLVDFRFNELSQRAAGVLLLLLQRGIEELDRLAVAELVRPGLQRAVAGNLVVLDGLRSSEQTGVESGHPCPPAAPEPTGCSGAFS